MVETRRVTVKLYPAQIEFLKKLRSKLNGFTDSECIRFCIDLTNLMLSTSPFGEELYRVLEEAVRRSFERVRGQTKS